MCSQRIPRGRRFFLILVMLVIERYVLYGAIDEVLDLIPELDKDADMTGLGTFLRVFLFYCVSRIFYPVGGFIADVYMGRCRVIHMSLWFYWIAFALLTVAHILQGLHNELHNASVLYTHILPIAAYVFMILAAGGFEPTLIPFGADQLEAAGSNELSSYFYWYYFAIQLGPLLNIFVNSGLSVLLPAQTADTMQVLATIIVTTCGLVLHKTLEHWYFKNILRENCIKLVAKVLWYAARVKRRMPQYRRAFRYGEGKIKRIDLAKRRYDGIFSGDQVEDVKTFCLLCLIIFCLCGYFFSQSG
ncbi:Protein NRT1/ PTR FAMILY 8.1 [Geodia barretti]|uniref:Protein NRT1/ PTR FAMILY 8.1 n=1 Tax=Geodia barretti TaxID=519541 RepID=A0AA35TNY5_GEOBA|nr:Protein NRT1/ PTR FAMILY 8.1 [Geodia barretti]CAI8051364.1 Protein NRT1/ PTR FAMILY 8.1 [Geodia barretti]